MTDRVTGKQDMSERNGVSFYKLGLLSEFKQPTAKGDGSKRISCYQSRSGVAFLICKNNIQKSNIVISLILRLSKMYNIKIIEVNISSTYHNDQEIKTVNDDIDQTVSVQQSHGHVLIKWRLQFQN